MAFLLKISFNEMVSPEIYLRYFINLDAVKSRFKKQLFLTCCPHTFEHLNPLPLGFSPHLPPPPPYCGSIHKPTQEILVHGLWKGQNFQVAGKCIDTTFTINIL